MRKTTIMQTVPITIINCFSMQIADIFINVLVKYIYIFFKLYKHIWTRKQNAFVILYYLCSYTLIINLSAIFYPFWEQPSITMCLQENICSGYFQIGLDLYQWMNQMFRYIYHMSLWSCIMKCFVRCDVSPVYDVTIYGIVCTVFKWIDTFMEVYALSLSCLRHVWNCMSCLYIVWDMYGTVLSLYCLRHVWKCKSCLYIVWDLYGTVCLVFKLFETLMEKYV